MSKSLPEYETLITPSGLTLYFSGQGLDKGPLPCLFYFALTGEESLTLEPFNQPVQFMKDKPIRIFSSTLPCHTREEKHTDAMARWANEIARGNDILNDFIFRSSENIKFLIEQGIAAPSKIAVSGLSRGSFLAAALAASVPHVNSILGWAPVTTLATLLEFKELHNHPLLDSFSPSRILPQLIHKKLRYYIGNQDTRVGTKECFEFVFRLATLAHEKHVRSPSAELIMSPSIGHKGHGTPPHLFKDGVDWAAKQML